mmetsp:Transcript_15234/g.38361  ORF Transcript_15234/g.38361 Transcript_15234/m.38361 type:complete len:188 (-) Transcript_15234:168-731(-)
MERVRSRAKGIINVPQKIGQSILEAPEKIFNKQREAERNEQRDEIAEDIHVKICSNIIDDQNGRIAVRESQEECMREITEHLKLFIFNLPDSVERYEYKDWIEALHPDNVNYLRSGRSIIDHRFYMKDSHHRNLWNEYMIKLDSTDSIVNFESRDMTKYEKNALIDTFAKWPNELCGTMGESCGLFP